MVRATVLVGHPSRLRILRALEAYADGGTVAEIARDVDLQHNAVRKQLHVLESAGLVRAVGANPGRTGRPAVRYRRVRHGANGNAELARLLARLAAESGASEHDAEDLGRREGRGLVSAGAGPDAVVDTIDDLGFSPGRIPAAPNVLDVELRRCAFLEAVLGPGAQLVCGLHRGLTAGMAEQALQNGRLVRFEIADPRSAHCRAVIGYGRSEPALTE